MAHFTAGREARAAAAAQAGTGDRGDHLFAGRRGHAPFERAVAVAREVLVDVERVDLAAVLEDDAALFGQVGGRRSGLAIDGSEVVGVIGAPESRSALTYLSIHARAARGRMCWRAMRRAISGVTLPYSVA